MFGTIQGDTMIGFEMDRRQFVQKVASGAIAATAVGLTGSWTAAATEPVKRSGGPRLKVSLNAYSFSKALLSKDPGQGMTLFDALDYCAEQNFDAIDPTGYYFPGYPKVPTDQYINDFKRRAFELGVEISGTGVRNNFATTDKAARAADVEVAKQWIEAAAKMGAPVIRVFAGAMPQGHNFDEVSVWMVEELQKCTEHGKQYGVKVGVQNHGDAIRTADEMLRIVRGVDSDWFGAIVDTGNFQDGGDPYQEIAKVAPYAVNWQVKEKVDGKDGKTRTDLPRLMTVIRQSGYRGYLPIEILYPTGEGFDPKVRVAEFLKEVRAAIGTA
jgi:sugar phosphate isomerase/epimerase